MSDSAPPEVILDHRCSNCPVRHHAICAVLDNQSSHALSDIMVHKQLVPGQPLWSDKDEAHLFAIIVSGTVKLFKMLADGRQQIVGLLFPSDCLGRAYSETQQTFAEAVTNVELCCFPRQQFEHVLTQHPELEHALLEKTLTDLDNAREWMIALGRKTASEKIASFLQQMSRRSELTRCPNHRPTPDLPTFVLPLARAEIADYLGMTMETVSRNLTKLRVDGVIRLIDGQTVEICDADRLASLAEPQ